MDYFIKGILVAFPVFLIIAFIVSKTETEKNFEKRFLLDAKIVCLDGVEYWHTFDARSIAPKYDRKGQVTFCDEDM
jgi:hypothetical protein